MRCGHLKRCAPIELRSRGAARGHRRGEKEDDATSGPDQRVDEHNNANYANTDHHHDRDYDDVGDGAGDVAQRHPRPIRRP